MVESHTVWLEKVANTGKMEDYNDEHAFFQILYDAPIPILIAQEDGQFLMVNHQFRESTGFTSEKFPTVNALTKQLRGYPEVDFDKRFTNLFETEKPLKPLRVSLKTKRGNSLIWELFNLPLGRTADGQRRVIAIASDITNKVEYERKLEGAVERLEEKVSKRTVDLDATIIALENEITERKQVSDALSLSRERLQRISRRILDLMEADRRTISKELHDSIGASLAAIKFSLEDKELKRAQDHGRLDEPLTQEIAYLLATIKETKRISANLRPTTLDDLGLMATINWYIRQFQRLYGEIRIQYTTEITEDEIPEPMKIVIYRIIQEGLSNAEKHSEAGSVRLHMGFSDGKHSIALSIEDNGHGFDVEEVLSRKDPLSGYGLIAMRERCEVFGGSFHIESKKGVGTKIQAFLHI